MVALSLDSIILHGELVGLFVVGRGRHAFHAEKRIGGTVYKARRGALLQSAKR